MIDLAALLFDSRFRMLELILHTTITCTLLGLGATRKS